MEVAQLSPHDGERPADPGPVEAWDSGPNGSYETLCHDDDEARGAQDNGRPYDGGAPRLQNTTAGDPRLRSHETARARHDEGAFDDEGSRASSSGGPEDCRNGQGNGDPTTRDDEAPRSGSSSGPGPRDDEAPRGPRYGSSEGPGPRDDEAPRGPRSGSSEGPDPRDDEVLRGPRSGSSERPGPRDDEAPRGSRSGSSEGPGPWDDEVLRGPRSGSSEGPGPRDDEVPRGPRSGCSEETRAASDEGPGNANASTWRDGAGAALDDVGDSSPDQRLTRSCGDEGTYDARAVNEGPDAASPAECYDAQAKDPAEQPHAEPTGHGPSALEGPSEGAESFKKPVIPSRSGWTEKTLDKCHKPVIAAPSSSQLPPAIDGSRETASDDSAGLPSDAYKAGPAVPYEEPPWSGRPPALYSLEVLKGGSILSTTSLNGASWRVFGRLPTCHIPLEHPSVSRYHAVLQYRPEAGPEQESGFYVYDLGSTHGTFINKQRIQPRTYHRIRVGHVLKVGGSTRLFILQGPDEDQEAESELSVTQIKEARRRQESLQKRMLGDDSDGEEEDDLQDEGEEKEQKQQRGGPEDASCMWGMGEDAVDEETDVNPIAVEYQAEQEALYSANPKKALQGFFDREGEELDFEYEERGFGAWICRVKLPTDDSSGKQLVAEVVHSGKKRDAMRLCSLEACRMLDMRGLLRQEAVSRKRKAKQWEAEDFYDSDDDTFLDRTGIVEKKRLNRMKKAGKIEEKPETYETLTAKLDLVEKEIVTIAAKLRTSRQGEAQTSSQDSLDAFMTEIKSGASVDSVTRKKLHLQSLELKKEQQRLKSLIKIVQPTRLPELKANPAAQDTKKLTLPMFGAMKGGSKFKLKTGTVGRLPPKRTDLPSSLFTMKGNNEPEEEEEDDDDLQAEMTRDSRTASREVRGEEQSGSSHPGRRPAHAADVEEMTPTEEPNRELGAPGAGRGPPNSCSPPAAQNEGEEEVAPKMASVTQRKVRGPIRPPQGALPAAYPEDDPDYCVWTPPAGQTGDGKTHLNKKYGY